MTSINCRQNKPIKVVILGLLFLGISIFGRTEIFQFLVLFIVGLVMLGYRTTYRISKDFKNKKIFSLFGIPVLKLKLDVLFPEYISIFGANFSISNEWGPIAALGTKSKSDKIVIRFFNGSENSTIFMSDDYVGVKKIATDLHQMLGVELIDNVKS